MRRNRAVRNQIEANLGLHAVEEVERYNDGAVDTIFEDDLSPEEEAAQAAVWENMVMHEILREDAAR